MLYVRIVYVCLCGAPDKMVIAFFDASAKRYASQIIFESENQHPARFNKKVFIKSAPECDAKIGRMVTRAMCSIFLSNGRLKERNILSKLDEKNYKLVKLISSSCINRTFVFNNIYTYLHPIRINGSKYVCNAFAIMT